MNAVIAPTVAAAPITIEIDGQALQVPKGSMIIEAADRAGIAIPRFCYHNKLSIAANCRMCLVDVEKAPKPMPACATPVMDGMKVYTQSKRALDAQRNVMEFLLINHPLDCPVCDQGGECELQDLAMGYGRSVSRFTERKRVVPDEDLGPLISTDMTRCIHCTRCVRFMTEIAGTTELGGMGRGEHLEIGTYIGKAIESEISGNIIDVCPVGALTNKVYRFRARAWELTARESIGYHDALGSNLYLHLRRGEVMRCVPRDNEAVNECWLSDRDRYSHEGLYASDRVSTPLVRRGGELVAVSWDDAIVAARAGFAEHGADVAALVAPMVACEEGLLLAEILKAQGSARIDHRLRVLDPAYVDDSAGFEMPLAQVSAADAIFLLGANPRMDQPLLGHRVRSAVNAGAKALVINPVTFDWNFEVAAARIADCWQLVGELAAVAASVQQLPEALAQAVGHFEVLDAHREMAKLLSNAKRGVVLFGDHAVGHPQASLLLALARHLARATGVALNLLPAGANGIGLSRVGVQSDSGNGTAVGLLSDAPRMLITYQCEAADFAQPEVACEAMQKAKFHLHIGAYLDPHTRQHATLVLPIGLPPEVPGTYLNVDGRSQRVAGGAKLPGDARPGWRVLRALGGALGVAGFDFVEFNEIQPRLSERLSQPLAHEARFAARGARPDGLLLTHTTNIYAVDAVVRRSPSLNATPLAASAALMLNPADASARGLSAGLRARVVGAAGSGDYEVHISPGIPAGSIWVESGRADAPNVGATGSVVRVEQADG